MFAVLLVRLLIEALVGMLAPTTVDVISATTTVDPFSKA